MATATDAKKAVIAAAIRVIPDFPKKGIMFQDVSTLLLDPAAFQASIDLFVEQYRPKDIQVIAGGSLWVAAEAWVVGVRF
jgi:adenine phosphoribosyltransferase